MALNDLLEKTDEELMNLYKAGDFHAFEVLYHRHSGRVYSYLKSKTSSELANDLLQDVFEKIHNSREKFNNQFPFMPWLFTIAKNTLLDFLKRSETKLSAKSNNSEYIIESIQDPNSKEQVDPLEPQEFLSSLPSKQKKTLELRYLEDWSFEKIAKEMHTSEGNVRKIVSRALTAIRQRKAFKDGGQS